VVVLDPDAAPGQWPGCRSFGHGDDYAGIGQALALVSQEIAKRRTARAEGQRRFTPVHIVIDESQDVIAEVPAALNVIETLARRGRKIGMHATLGVQDKQVKTLGLEGKSDLLRNFQVVDMVRKDGQRVAILHTADGNLPMPVPDLISPEEFIMQKPAAQCRATPADDLLASLLTDTSISASGRQDTDDTSISIGTNPRDTDTDTDTSISASGRGDTGVTVNIHARAEVARATAAGRQRTRRGQGVDVKRRAARNKARLAAERTKELENAYKLAGKNGESFNRSYERLGGNRNQMIALWREGKKEAT
jgi:hypothetical protein